MLVVCGRKNFLHGGSVEERPFYTGNQWKNALLHWQSGGSTYIIWHWSHTVDSVKLMLVLKLKEILKEPLVPWLKKAGLTFQLSKD